MSAASSERFELIQDDLETILEGILSSLTILSKKSQSSKAGSKEEVRHWIMRTRSSLVEARKLIEDMEQEARLAPIQFRGDMLTKVRQYREDTAKLQAQLRGFTEINTSGFGDSLNIRNPRDGPDWPEVTVEDRYRRQVLEGSNILERTSQSIQRSEQVAVETEAVGGEIISDLSVQREQLERTRGRIYDTYDELSRSQRILRRIYFGVIQNKVVLIVIIVIEILIIAGLVYLRFFS
ncbi:vesicle transport through interaction with t-SNAREs homolog 1B-like [Tigriopus californicus]|uniref:vesicle transport through interaction with t-SNAREs homolog 1B-like n=1 Tax=Tigriopus californicus TaxID=6832 RepID=UPI0027D9F58A|nr:vesicle transport through interaction with t-SNAREs homolog 1B-like [Tigriopus californicus]